MSYDPEVEPAVWTARRSGRPRHADDARSDYQIDYARVIHSSSFRRLQGKTQILALGDDDFYRTRLTHSLEVAQVAEGVVQQLRMQHDETGIQEILPPSGLIGAIGLAHDLGHPPFGHGGEIALNYCMRDAGGFEGNGQTLRILSRLEGFSPRHGADLTRRAMLGALKYPIARNAALNPSIIPSLDPGPSTIAVLDRHSCKPAKTYYDEEADVVSWILEPLSVSDRELLQQVWPRAGAHGRALHKSFDCSIMDLADDIAYGVHDLEDAIALGLVGEERFRTFLPAEHCPTLIDALVRRPLDTGIDEPYHGLVSALFGDTGARKRAIGRLVHHFLRNIDIPRDSSFDEPRLGFRARLPIEVRALLDRLQALVVADVIENPRVQHLEFKGQRMVIAVFEAMCSDPVRLLPPAAYARYADGGGRRAICDYIAAMTDGALLKTYDRLFSPRMGSVFDRL
jgi:dGTPase